MTEQEVARRLAPLLARALARTGRHTQVAVPAATARPAAGTAPPAARRQDPPPRPAPGRNPTDTGGTA